MTSKITFLTALSVCTLLIIIDGCKKATQDPALTSTATAPPEVKVAEDNAQVDYIFNDLNNIVDDAARSEGGVNKMLGCPIITSPSFTSPFPKTMVLDYGPVGAPCTGVDGRKRSGSISATFSDRRNVQNSTMTIDHSTYMVEGIQVTGKTIVTTIMVQPVTDEFGVQRNVPVKWNTVVNGSLVSNSTTRTWESNRTRFWQSGYTTLSKMDDQFNFWGTSIGTNSDTTFVDPATCLMTAPTCRYIIKGKATIHHNGKKIVINYGEKTDTCDAKATVSINGGTPLPFTLK